MYLKSLVQNILPKYIKTFVYRVSTKSWYFHHHILYYYTDICMYVFIHLKTSTFVYLPFIKFSLTQQFGIHLYTYIQTFIGSSYNVCFLLCWCDNWQCPLSAVCISSVVSQTDRLVRTVVWSLGSIAFESFIVIVVLICCCCCCC